jgi:CRISPR-associated endonuclease Csn1
MGYRLALDIGTASCGLIAVKLNSQDEPGDVIHQALHIFSEPLLPAKSGGVGEPKKAARRAARMARRIIDRRARRLKRIALLSALLDLDRHQIAPDSGQTIHEIRAKAASESISLEDFLKVMLKLAKRRGYAGTFKTRKDSEQGQVQSGINILETQMKAAGSNTLGQYLDHRFATGKTLKLKEEGLYAHRDMLKAEFETIWNAQARHHPILNESRPDPLKGGTRLIRDQFADAIFYQRPLKSVAPMVGNCPLEPSLPRAPMAQPAMQTFRIEKQLADLRWGMGRNAAALTVEQRSAIRDMLNDPAQITKEGKLSFKKIYAQIEDLNLRPAHHRSLNMERSSREELTGNRTLRAFKDLGVLDAWTALGGLTQTRVINFLADLGSPDQVDQPDWHTRFTKKKLVKNAKSGRWEERQVPRDLDSKMVSFVNVLIDTKKFDRLSNMGFQTGRAGYSIRALEKLTARMQSGGLDEHDAIQECYPPAVATGELLSQLSAHKPTGNVVVDVALGVVRRAVNDALAKLGKPPAEVVVELSRDMALGTKARGEIEKRIDKNQRLRDRARKELAAHDMLPTERNVLRYLLWEQQDKRHCPYCSEPINLEQVVDGNATNFEHILPRTLTRVGRQRNHLALAHRSCNDLKRDRTPFEAFGNDPDRWAAVAFCASVLEGNKQFAKARLLRLQDYEHEVLDEASIAEFSERQYAETSWIGKLTAQWMREISPRVYPSRGAMTAHLRRIWKLETVIAEARFEANLPVLDTDGDKISLDEFSRFKPFWEGHTSSTHPRTDRKIDKRIDHRHHLIDALVIAQTSVSLYQRMARHYKELAERRTAGEAVRLKLEAEPPIRDLREKALNLVKQVAVVHKPDRHGGGAFFQEFAYGTTTVDDDGRLYLCRRKNLASFVKKTDSVEKARKQIKSIVSSEVRKIVQTEFEKRIGAGKSPFEALQDAVPYPLYRNGIRTVNCIQGLAESASVIGHRSRHAEHKKVLIDEGWACLVVKSPDGRRVESHLISPRMMAQRSSARSEDGRAVYFKGDTVLDTASGKKYLIRQIKAQAGGLLILTPIVDAREVRDMTAAEGLKTISGKGLLNLRPA